MNLLIFKIREIHNLEVDVLVSQNDKMQELYTYILRGRGPYLCLLTLSEMR